MQNNTLNNNPLSGIRVNTTQPTSITFHQIEDNHLEVLMKTNSPISSNMKHNSSWSFLRELYTTSANLE